MTGTAPTKKTPLRRARFARELARTGLLLAAVMTGLVWAGALFTLVPASRLLDRASTELTTLEGRLAEAQSALAPLDVLSRPETLGAVQALNTLATRARGAPLLDLVIPPDTLEQAVTLTQDWETALRSRPPLPLLTDARQEVRTWGQKLQDIRARIRLIAVLYGLVMTLMLAWFAAGQWALRRWAEDQIAAPDEPSAAKRP